MYPLIARVLVLAAVKRLQSQCIVAVHSRQCGKSVLVGCRV